MKPRVYIETSVPSYLTARTTRDLLVASHQQIIIECWDRRRQDFDLFVSEIVIRECRGGDPLAAALRERSIRDLPSLEITDDVLVLSETLLRDIPLPAKASADSMHIATSAVHRMDFLLTWNCQHIANARFRKAIVRVCAAGGFAAPVICTPEELI